MWESNLYLILCVMYTSLQFCTCDVSGNNMCALSVTSDYCFISDEIRLIEKNEARKRLDDGRIIGSSFCVKYQILDLPLIYNAMQQSKNIGCPVYKALMSGKFCLAEPNHNRTV